MKKKVWVALFIGTCYKGSNNATTACDFASSGLSDEAKNNIGNAVWHVGGNGSVSIETIITSKFYELERSSNHGKNCTSSDICNDTVARTTKWTGQIALMGPSDYGYATKGNTNISRDECLKNALLRWDVLNATSNCIKNDWLYNNTTEHQWTMMPGTGASAGTCVYTNGNINTDYVSQKNLSVPQHIFYPPLKSLMVMVP